MINWYISNTLLYKSGTFCFGFFLIVICKDLLKNKFSGAKGFAEF